MSAIEQESPHLQPPLTASREIAHIALQQFQASNRQTYFYRPDYMTESFAHEVTAELDSLDIEATVVATWLKGMRVRKPDQTYAVELSFKKLADVISIKSAQKQ